MHKLLIVATIAGIVTVSGSAWAQEAHHDHALRPTETKSVARQMPLSCPQMKVGNRQAMRGKSHKMSCMNDMNGMHDMSGMHDGRRMMGGGMDKGQMQQMHGQMNHGPMAGGTQPAATPNPAKPK